MEAAGRPYGFLGFLFLIFGFALRAGQQGTRAQRGCTVSTRPVGTLCGHCVGVVRVAGAGHVPQNGALRHRQLDGVQSARRRWSTGQVTETDLVIRCRGAELPAILTRPAAACRAAMILLHPADDGGRRQFLFEHLAGLLPRLGVAVLRYDRRAAAAGRDVPYLLQAEDLSHARDVLTTEIG
jgi:hypothetical protein